MFEQDTYAKECGICFDGADFTSDDQLINLSARESFLNIQNDPNFYNSIIKGEVNPFDFNKFIEETLNANPIR